MTLVLVARSSRPWVHHGQDARATGCSMSIMNWETLV